MNHIYIYISLTYNILAGRCIAVDWESVYLLLLYFFYIFLRPKNSPAKHGQRWPTAPLDESPPESNGTTRRHGPTTRRRRLQPAKKENGENTQSQACAHVVWCRRGDGRGVALRLQPEVLQSSSREVRATATRRSTARREHTT